MMTIMNPVNPYGHSSLSYKNFISNNHIHKKERKSIEPTLSLKGFKVCMNNKQ